MAYAKDYTLTITSGSPAGNTVYEAINYTDLNIDGIYTDLNALDARVGYYGTIWVPADQMYPATTGPCASVAYKETGATTKYDMAYLAFDGGATEEAACFLVTMPENWDRGTIKAKFYWSTTTGTTATTDTVEWEIAGVAVGDSDAISALTAGTPQVIADVLLADAGGDIQITAATPALTVGGTPALGDLVVFRVSRNTGSTSDNFAEDAWLFGVRIQYAISNSVSSW